MKKNILFTFLFTINYFFCCGQPGMWTWMKGDTTINPNGNFGTQGVADLLNKPTGFYEMAEWKGDDGNLWFFGGLNVNYQEFGDIWKFDITSNEWTWVKGSGLPQQPGVYGTLGVSSPANHPGARSWGSVTWVGLDGNFWIYGGWGYDSNGSYGTLNDLWKYDPATNEWAWMNGSTFGMQLPVYGTQGIPSPANTPGARGETNTSWVDSLGNLWLFGGWDGMVGYNDLWKFDIATSEWTWMKGSNIGNQAGTYGTLGVSNAANTPGGRIAYGKWKDADGKFWLFAGYNASVGEYWNDIWKYDPGTNEWTWMAGSNFVNANNSVSALCDPAPTNHPTGRHENRACWSDCAGHFWTFGGHSGTGIYSDLWTFDSNTLEWTLVNGTINVNMPGHYGTQGVGNANNYPKARWGAIAWMDNDCNLWLQGGASINFNDRLNDLWKFQPDPDCPGTFVCTSSCISSVGFSSSAISLCKKFCIDFFDNSTNNPTAWQWIFSGGSPSTSTDQNPLNICYNDSGTFDVTLITTSAGGNDTLTLPGYITVFPTPAIPVITQNGYTITSTNAATYQWQFNNADIPGATNQSYTVTQTGYYTVDITDQNGCSASATIYILITGMEELFSDMNVLIYPNPSEGSFIVELSNCQIDDAVKIQLHNTLGQIVFSEEEKILNAHFLKKIDARGFSPGLYILSVKTDHVTVNKKLISNH